jgi:hypothetical protein
VQINQGQQQVSRTKPKSTQDNQKERVRTFHGEGKKVDKSENTRSKPCCVVQVVTTNEKNQKSNPRREKKKTAGRKPFEAKHNSIWLLDRRRETDKGN